MQAIILTAGYGRRMQPLSDRCHKALLPVGGTTILGRIMDGLTGVGIDRVTVVTGYRSEDIEGFLRSAYPAVNTRFVKNDRFEETNNIVSLSLALETLEYNQDIVLVECDLLFEPGVLRSLLDHPADNVALLDHYRSGMDGTVVALSQGVVSQVFPPHLQVSDFSYRDKFKTLNVYRFHRDFCNQTLRPLLHVYANSIDENCYYEVVLGMLSNVPRHRIAGEVVDGRNWVEVDDPNDLAVARFRFEPDQRTDVLDRALGGYWNFDLLDFSFMRNAFFPTDPMLSAMRHALPELIANYGSSQSVLNEKLSYFLKCRADRLQAVHGGTQLYPILRHHWAGRSVAIPDPTFGEYPRAFPGSVTYPDSVGIRMDDLEGVAAEVDVLVVVNPNNPTGTTLATADLLALAERHPRTTILVDESFQVFSGQPSLVGFLEARAPNNMVVLTSLSKALGIPGLRLGYLYTADADLIAAVGAELPIWNLGSMTEFFLELLLKFRPDLDQSLVLNDRARDILRHDLTAVPAIDHVHPSGGNFLLVCLDGDRGELAAEVRRRLLIDAAVETKDVTGKFHDGRPRLRVGVRTIEENRCLVDALMALRLPAPP